MQRASTPTGLRRRVVRLWLTHDRHLLTGLGSRPRERDSGLRATNLLAPLPIAVPAAAWCSARWSATLRTRLLGLLGESRKGIGLAVWTATPSPWTPHPFALVGRLRHDHALVLGDGLVFSRCSECAGSGVDAYPPDAR